MQGRKPSLGRLISTHVIAPVHVQRAVFVAVLSFMFFMTMMFAFYALQSALYFLLSTAFLIVYLITMFSIVMQRRSNVEIHENGLKYKKHSVAWTDIKAVQPSGSIEIGRGKSFQLPTGLADFDLVLARIRSQTSLSE